MDDLKTQIPSQEIQSKLENISRQINEHALEFIPYKCKVRLTDAYTMVYDNCVKKPYRNQQMLTLFKQLLISHLMSTVRSYSDPNKIKEFNYYHESYVGYAYILIKKVFSHLDRYYLPSRDLGSLTELSLNFLHRNLLGTPELRANYLQCFIQTLGEFRSRMVLSANQLYTFSVNMAKLNPDFYMEIKKAYLFESHAFYHVKFNENKHLSPAHYYPKIHNLSLFEDVITTKCFLWSFNDQGFIIEIRNLYIKELIQPYVDNLLSHHQGLAWILQNRKYQTMNSIIDVYDKFEGLARIKEKYYEFVVEQANNLVKAQKDETDSKKIIKLMVQFFEDQNKTLTQGWLKNREFQVTLSNAIENVMARWDKYAQILFNYCKEIVTKGQFQGIQKSIELAFEKLANKDEFIYKCQKWLEDNILAEKVELTKLNQFFTVLHELCGAQNTLKLQNITKDYVSENDLQAKSPLSPKVISFHLWERRFKADLAINFTLPESLNSIWKQFETKYIERQPKKKLTLLPLSSTVLLGARISGKNTTIRCNLLHSCIIMMLVEKGRSIEQLQAEIHVEKHLLQSFIQLSKLIVLKDNIYEFDWSANVQNDIDLTVQIQNDSKFTKAIEQDRNILLEAAVVRVVKRRKEVSFEEIFDYLYENIKMFKPQPAVVKSTIEKLIKKDFIEQNDKGVYLYIE